MKPADPVTRIFKSKAPSQRFLKTAPDVDDPLVRDRRQLAVDRVRGGDEENVRLGENSLQRRQGGIAHVVVRAQDLAVLQGEQLAQLVAQRVAGVVALGL